MSRVLILACAIFLTRPISACAATSQLIQIDGSSTVFPISRAVAEGFVKLKQGAIKVTVGISGTGGGFKKFCRGEIDINDASRPILKSEMQICKKFGIRYMELPIAYDALTVTVNPHNYWVKSLTVTELKKIWEPAAQGKVMIWNQIRSQWPNRPLKLFGPGEDSGTFDYFTEAIVGKAKSSRTDFTTSEDDNVLVRGIADDQNALGYFGYAYHIENQKKLKAVAIDRGKGAVFPSSTTVEDGTYEPFSRPVFIYACKKSLDRPEVGEFVAYYLTKGPQIVKQVKYVPLPASGYATVISNVKTGKLGTVFGGQSEVGVKISDLLKREAKIH